MAFFGKKEDSDMEWLFVFGKDSTNLWKEESYKSNDNSWCLDVSDCNSLLLKKEDWAYASVYRDYLT